MKHASTILAAILALAHPLILFADVRDTPSERTLSLPTGKPALVIPRSDWVIAREQRKPGDTTVYYLLNSGETQLILSAYIDKSTVCRAADECLQSALKNQSYNDAKELKMLDAASFKAASFYLDNPKGAPVKQAHVLAAAYVDGVWFDVHISKGGAERSELGQLVELLKSLSIR